METIDRALEHYTQGRLDEAERLYQQILQADPNQPFAIHLLGVIAYQRGDHALAVDRITQALIAKPNFAEAHNNLGLVYQGLGQWDAAAASHQKAIALQPENAEAHNNLGNALGKLGKPDAAAASLRRSLAIRPDNAETYLNLGIALQDASQLDDAIASLKQAIALNPDYAEAHLHLAILYNATGRSDAAIDGFKAVLAIDPGHTKAAYFLSALTDASTEAPPEGFVRQVFDEHADVFEQRMKDGSSRLPEMIRAVAGTFIEGSADVGAPAFANVLDLGCGTGRAGVEFRDIAGTIHGVDLSPKMMDQARDKGVYDDLFLDDFVAFMDSAKGAYDLVLAVDSFLYTGPLEVVFASVAGVLKGGGGFAFTVEALDEGDFALRDTCRHAHGEAYIRRLAAEGGFSVNVCVSIANMRFDVKGTLFWLDKSG